MASTINALGYTPSPTYSYVNTKRVTPNVQRNFNEPAFSLSKNLKSVENIETNNVHSSFEQKVHSSDVFNTIKDNGVWYVGERVVAHTGAVAAPAVTVATPTHYVAPSSAPVHVVTAAQAPVHVVAAPKHVAVVAPAPVQVSVPAPTPAPENKPILDPFKDKDAIEIAEEDEIIKEREMVRAVNLGLPSSAAVSAHNERCHEQDPTGYHTVNLNSCPCNQEIAPAIQFYEHGDETKKVVGFFWWLLPLILVALFLIALLLALFYQKKPTIPTKKFVIERKTKEEDEAEIEAEIQRQLEKKITERLVQQQNEEEEVKVFRDGNAVNSAPPPRDDSPQEQSPGNSSSKKVVKKRIVKMMKEGKLIAEKEEILDEEGNVLRTQIRKQEE